MGLVMSLGCQRRSLRSVLPDCTDADLEVLVLEGEWRMRARFGNISKSVAKQIVQSGNGLIKLSFQYTRGEKSKAHRFVLEYESIKAISENKVVSMYGKMFACCK